MQPNIVGMDRIGITDDMADWTDLDLWGQSIIECVTEELITGWEAMEFSYGGSMVLKDTDPLTGEKWEETAMLCDTSLDRLEWLENTVEGKAFHKRLQTILEQPVFFRNGEISK